MRRRFCSASRQPGRDCWCQFALRFPMLLRYSRPCRPSGTTREMRSLIWKCLVGVALMAVVVVPAAAAEKRPTRQVRLSLVPLQAAQIGGGPGKGLRLAHDSGPVSNAAAANMSFTGSRSGFKRLGRVSGYALDYGDAFSCASSLTTQIQTYVEQYKTVADAKRGLAFWKRDDAQVQSLNVESGFDVDAFGAVKLPAVGTRHYAYFTEYNPFTVACAVQVLDERFTEGRYVLQVKVSSGTDGPSNPSAQTLAKRLDRRLRSALSGRLHATAAKLPPVLKAGPAEGGPDLSRLVIQGSDLGGGTTAIQSSRYFVDRLALSAYGIAYEPAGGTYDLLSQEIEWYPTRNEAAFRSAYDEALDTALLGGSQVTTVNLDSIRYGARGTITRIPATGGSVSIAVIGLWRGQAKDVVVAESKSQIQPSDVQGLAQATATRLDAVPCQTCIRRGGSPDG